MAYLFRKKSHGIDYLYRGVNKRMGGKPTCVNCESLGRFEDFAAYFQQRQKLFFIENQHHFEYGLSRTVHELSKQFMYERIFQNNISKRTKDKYLHTRVLVMVLNRIINPIPKYHIKEWFTGSDLVNSIDLPPEELEEQKVYRTMDLMDKYCMGVQEDIAKSILLQQKISFDMLYLDFTNQETFSKNEESKLLKQGHNKRKRFDLKQINIALNCDAHSGIPFFHKTYPGNVNDPTFIKEYAPELRDHLRKVGWDDKSTLIIDRGMNGDTNFKLLRAQHFDYIGGLIEDDFPQFFNIPKSALRKRYTKKRKKPKPLIVKYTYQKAHIYGTTHWVITAYTQENNEIKIKELDEKIIAYKKKCIQQLQGWKKEIRKKTIRAQINNVEKIKKKLRKINKKIFHLFDFEIKSYRFELTWTIKQNRKNYEKYTDNLGKYVIFSNRLDLTPTKIMDYFYNKDLIEKNFQILKSNAYNYLHVVLGPMFHKRDDRIESHTFDCILALQLYQIIDYRLKKRKFPLTTQQALKELRKITCYYTKLENNPFPLRHINPLTEIQKQILETLEVNIFH